MTDRIYIPRYDSNDVKHAYTALSDDNDYIPVSSLSTGYRLILRSRKTFMYGLPVLHWGAGMRKIHLICQQLSQRVNGLCSSGTVFKRCYLVGNGVVLWRRNEDYRDIPLLLLCVKKDYLFSIDKDNPNPSQFALVIDRSFITDEEHFKLYRNVKRIYIDEIEQYLDVVYTNDIVNRCFEVSLPKPGYKTITEMLNGFKQVNKLVVKCIKKEVDIGFDI